MLRTLQKDVLVPSDVKLEISGNLCKISGKNGNQTLVIPEFVQCEKIDNRLEINVIGLPRVKNEIAKGEQFVRKEKKSAIKIDKETKKKVIVGGTFRQLVDSYIQGIAKKYETVLILEGVGYRATVTESILNLFVGYSHKVDYNIPKSVSIVADKPNRLILSSFDKAILGQTVAEIKKVRPPEPYKGKGIRIENEVIRRKAGKTGKK